MSMNGCRSIQRRDSCLKITDSIACKGEDHRITKNEGEDYVITNTVDIDNLAFIKFKWDAKTIGKKLKIEIRFSASKQELAKHRTIKLNVASDTLNYSEQDIDISVNWSEWQLMGSLETVLQRDIYVVKCDYYVSVFEVKIDKLCLKLHADTDFTDFNLATSEGSINIHKSCLAAHSEVFKTMLTGEWKETAEGKINIKGASLQTLHDLKKYLYLGAVPDDYDYDSLCPLLLIARCYLIEDLEKQCIRKLAETVLPIDVYSLVEFACENNIPELAYAMLQKTQDSVITKAHALKRARPGQITLTKDEV